MDLTFKTEQGRFNYRVGAVIINDGKILMAKSDGSPYYSVGGRVQFGETAEQAVLREIYEETGVNAEIDRPLFVHENFFVAQETGEFFHEISLYFLIKQNPAFTQKLQCNSYTDRGTKEKLYWLDINKLGNLNAKPDFFATELKSLPSSIKFMFTDDRKKA